MSVSQNTTLDVKFTSHVHTLLLIQTKRRSVQNQVRRWSSICFDVYFGQDERKADAWLVAAVLDVALVAGMSWSLAVIFEE